MPYSFSRNTFRNFTPGDVINFLIPNGLSIRDGRTVQDWKPKRGKVVMAFEGHVVCNGGGRFGTPYVVDENNCLTAAK